MGVLNGKVYQKSRDAFVIADPFVVEIIGKRFSEGTETESSSTLKSD